LGTAAVEARPSGDAGQEASSLCVVAALFWKTFDAFAADLRGADDDKLRNMHQWAKDRENNADVGMGRNPKARRMFRHWRMAAEDEIDRRGLVKFDKQ
jgi:hypothetical protein